MTGLEPTTSALRKPCSTVELHRRKKEVRKQGCKEWLRRFSLFPYLFSSLLLHLNITRLANIVKQKPFIIICCKCL